MTKSSVIAVAAFVACAWAPHCYAYVVIDFEELESFDNHYDFYSGGLNNAGVSGPDLGILITGGFTARSAGNTALTFDEIVGESRVEVTGGFSGGFAFRFALELPANVTVQIRDINREILASGAFTAPPSGIGVDPVTGEPFYEDWAVAGIAFDGVAHEVWFDDDLCCVPAVLLDDLTFGRTTLVPLPASAWLLLTAFALSAGALRRLRLAPQVF